MPLIIMSRGLIGLSTRTLRSIARSSTWAASYLRPSWAAFITIIAESDFRTAVLRPRQSIEANHNLRELLAAPLVQIQKLRTVTRFARWKRYSRISRKLRRGGQHHEH